MKSTSKRVGASFGNAILAISLTALLPVTALAQTVSFSPATNFNTQSNVNASSNPLSVAIGDLNGDGKPDLVAANYGSNNVSIHLGDGAGAFGTATHFAVGVESPSGPDSVAIGDLNGDGKPDLAVANFFGDTVSVLLGDGTGAFGGKVDYAVGVESPSIPRSVAIGDLNGDGHPDLAVANSNNPGSVSVLLGTGDGAFGAATNVVVAVFGGELGVYPTSVAIGDVNGDGHPDLAVAMQTWALFDFGAVSISLGTGTGTFGTATTFAVGVRPLSVAIGDFNGDGHPDLAVVNRFLGAFLGGYYPGPATVSILLGTGAGTFGLATDFAVGRDPFSVAIGDLNGDGNPDLAVANFGSNGDASVSVLLGTGAGTFAAATDFAVFGGLYSVAIGDLNGDGKPDLAVANEPASAVSVLLNTTVSSAVYNFIGFLPPIRNDGSSVFKVGQPIPVKFQLTAADATFITNAVATLQVFKGATLVTTGAFRFDPITNQYIFNLRTRGFTADSYRLHVLLDDGTTHDVLVSLKVK